MSPVFDSHPRELISAWLDGELSHDERTLVIEHLADCPLCRALVDDLTLLKKAQRDEAIPAVPEDLEKQIAWRLRSVKATPPRAGWRKLVPLTAVASVAIIGILVVVLREQKLTPTLAPDLEVQRNEKASEPSAPPAADEDREQRRSIDSLGEKKETDDLARLRSQGYLGGSKGDDSGAVAKQVPAAPPPPAEAPAHTRQKDARLDEPAREPAAAPVQEMAKERAVTAPLAQAADAGARRAEGAAGAAPSNEAASELHEGFAPVPKAAAKSLAAVCRSPWNAPESLEGKISRERLAGIVTGLGGSVTPDAGDSSLYRIDVPIGRWRAFQDALAALDVRGAEGGGVPEAGADCVRVAVRILP